MAVSKYQIVTENIISERQQTQIFTVNIFDLFSINMIKDVDRVKVKLIISSVFTEVKAYGASLLRATPFSKIFYCFINIILRVIGLLTDAKAKRVHLPEKCRLMYLDTLQRGSMRV